MERGTFLSAVVDAIKESSPGLSLDYSGVKFSHNRKVAAVSKSQMRHSVDDAVAELGYDQPRVHCRSASLLLEALLQAVHTAGSGPIDSTAAKQSSKVSRTKSRRKKRRAHGQQRDSEPSLTLQVADGVREAVAHLAHEMRQGKESLRPREAQTESVGLDDPDGARRLLAEQQTMSLEQASHLALAMLVLLPSSRLRQGKLLASPLWGDGKKQPPNGRLCTVEGAMRRVDGAVLLGASEAFLLRHEVPTAVGSLLRQAVPGRTRSGESGGVGIRQEAAGAHDLTKAATDETDEIFGDEDGEWGASAEGAGGCAARAGAGAGAGAASGGNGISREPLWKGLLQLLEGLCRHESPMVCELAMAEAAAAVEALGLYAWQDAAPADSSAAQHIFDLASFGTGVCSVLRVGTDNPSMPAQSASRAFGSMLACLDGVLPALHGPDSDKAASPSVAAEQATQPNRWTLEVLRTVADTGAAAAAIALQHSGSGDSSRLRSVPATGAGSPAAARHEAGIIGPADELGETCHVSAARKLCRMLVASDPGALATEGGGWMQALRPEFQRIMRAAASTSQTIRSVVLRFPGLLPAVVRDASGAISWEQQVESCCWSLLAEFAGVQIGPSDGGTATEDRSGHGPGSGSAIGSASGEQGPSAGEQPVPAAAPVEGKESSEDTDAEGGTGSSGSEAGVGTSASSAFERKQRSPAMLRCVSLLTAVQMECHELRSDFDEMASARLDSPTDTVGSACKSATGGAASSGAGAGNGCAIESSGHVASEQPPRSVGAGVRARTHRVQLIFEALSAQLGALCPPHDSRVSAHGTAGTGEWASTWHRCLEAAGECAHVAGSAAAGATLARERLADPDDASGRKAGSAHLEGGSAHDNGARADPGPTALKAAELLSESPRQGSLKHRGHEGRPGAAGSACSPAPAATAGAGVGEDGARVEEKDENARLARDLSQAATSLRDIQVRARRAVARARERGAGEEGAMVPSMRPGRVSSGKMDQCSWSG